MSLGTRLTAKVGEQRGEPKQGSCSGFLGGSWLALLPGQQTCSCAHKNRRRRLIEEQLLCTVLSVRVSRGALHPCKFELVTSKQSSLSSHTERWSFRRAERELKLKLSP